VFLGRLLRFLPVKIAGLRLGLGRKRLSFVALIVVDIGLRRLLLAMGLLLGLVVWMRTQRLRLNWLSGSMLRLFMIERGISL
jgi:hypothetical protein